MIRVSLAIVCVALFCVHIDAAPSADAVLHLPDFGTPPNRQWSGFLDASNGTFLHYWFAESSAPEPTKAPVLLWLNGGPGSSSILGMLQEQGPLIINATGGLMVNPYAWTTQVNLIILEAPAGVGYSYCTKNGKKSLDCANTDKLTAANNRRALQDFFNNKFPELAANKFYIAGESYAGVYVPTLAKEVLDNSKINIHGVAVGDPCTDTVLQKESMDMLWYANKHGLVETSDYELLTGNCSFSAPHPLGKGSWKAGEARTRPQLSEVAKASPACVAAHRRFLASSSMGFSQVWGRAWLNNLSLYGPSAVVPFTQPGSLNYMTATYMMRPDVRAALHLEDSPTMSDPKLTWPGPQAGWSYESDYAACNDNYEPGTWSMVDFYRNIAPRLSRTVVFNGDTDPCVSYEGTREAIKQVGFPEVNAYRPWFFNSTATTVEFLQEKPLLFGPDLSLLKAGPQYGGSVVDYTNNLSFITVHGAGHMVPQFRPRAALHMLTKVLSGADFAPPLTPGDSLSDMTDDAFEAFLDKWTDAAQTAPYVPKYSLCETDADCQSGGDKTGYCKPNGWCRCDPGFGGQFCTA